MLSPPGMECMCDGLAGISVFVYFIVSVGFSLIRMSFFSKAIIDLTWHRSWKIKWDGEPLDSLLSLLGPGLSPHTVPGPW